MLSYSNALLKQGDLELVAQDHAQTTFEYLKDGDPTNLSRVLVLVFSHPQSKKTFPDVQREHVFQFVPIASCAEEKRVLCLYADYSTELC